MRTLQVAGIVLILLGTFLLWKQPTYKSRQDVVRVGDFKASVQQEKAVPPWLGLTAVGAGVVILVVGGRRRS